ncbi:hypothetical protein BDN72DRAFT_776612, partial [Pluteus cervinus]
KIANMIFARWSNRHMLRIFFPRLGGPGSTRATPQLTPEEVALFYNAVVRPAVLETEPGQVHNWPATYTAERFRARNQRYGFQNSTLGFPRRSVAELSAAIVRLANATIPWARDLVFGTQVRGVKLHNSHDEDDEEGPVEALGDLLRRLDATQGHWWVDVGLEVMDRGRALLWRDDSHVDIIAEALGIPAVDAAPLRRSRDYERDICSHLSSISGFRLKCHGRGPFEAAYLQAYTTDKAATYHREGRTYAKTLTTNMAMKGSPPDFCQSLRATYEDCSRHSDVAARLEIRVPLHHAARVLTNPRQAHFRSSLVTMSRNVWW